MSQETNLNVSPYFDDFDPKNDYYKILFKPGYPVQARELTTLQSTLQNQIEKFGQHFFKEGAKVIPGNISYNQFFYAVQIQPTYLGVPVEAYISQLVGTKIIGESSGITATVEKILLSSESERDSTTLYVNYVSSSTQNNSSTQFFDGENLLTTTTVTSGLLGNQFISEGSPFATTIASGATSVASSFSISEGVYFIRGQFVNVNTETLILDQYSSSPSYRVGLFVNEEIVTSDMDESLNDNSQGFNNYSSPGADRLKITTTLFKKSLNDFNDNNFVELATIESGIIKTNRTTKEYSIIADELARRTYAESGDYYATPFDVSIKESLNDNLGNRGIFNEGQFTYNGSIPSESLAIYQISPGKAFVKGYEVETVSNTFLDVPKPRTTKKLERVGINYNTGSTLMLNRVYGSPVVSLGNTYVVSLRDSRVGIASTTPSGKEIGVARVYDFKLESGSYDLGNNNINQWAISLFDVQTTTEVTLNSPITLSVPTYIQGKNSGATGFLKDSVTNSTSFTIYQKNGDFVPNESFNFNGISNTRIAIALTSYGLGDVKSIYGVVGSARTFNADSIQSAVYNVGLATISTVNNLGISTITSTNPDFPGKIVQPGNLISFSNYSSDISVYASVVSVGRTNITVTGVTTVIGINEGKLPNATLNAVDLKILKTLQARSTDDTLFTPLPRPNVATIDLNDSSLTIRRSYNVTILNGQLSTPVTAEENEVFLPFDEERYCLIRSNGLAEVLTEDKFDFTNGSTQLQIYNLGGNDSATLIVTLEKIKPKSKIKFKNRINTLIVDRSNNQSSGAGATTLNDGLFYGNYPYGTRVQDEIISLNVPDVINVYAVYESRTTDNASAPTVVLSSINGTTTTTIDLIIGEQFVGQLSGAIGVYAERLTNSEISFIPQNETPFKQGEPILFRESKIQAVITSLDSPSSNISANFKFDNGQRGSHYGHAFITRNSSASSPSKKLKIYYANGYYQGSDNGDITTVESYNSFDYIKDIQTVNSMRNCDMIDIRPRVSNYTLSENSRSPLEFYGRIFNADGNSSKNVLASNESIVTTFTYYLGRIDRVFLRKDGTFQIQYGVPSDKPEKPIAIDDALEVATITLSPYLFDVSQSGIQFLEHKRYRMVDIKQLESRIKNLEYYTALSLLETSTANLFVPDSGGLDRFKSGFFVDNFSSLQSQESGIPYENSIDIKNKELRPKHYTTSTDLIQGPVDGIDPFIDYSTQQPEGFNIIKNSDIITLDYSEVEYSKQSFATRTENVTPFVISFWQATIELTPASDTWVDTVRLDAKVINAEGNYAQTLALAAEQFNVDPQTGYSPTVWGAWETNWTGKEVIETVNVSSKTTTNYHGYYGYWYGYPYGYYGYYWGYYGYYGYYGWYGRGWSNTTTVTQDTYKEIKETGEKTRTGTTTFITEQFDRQSIGDKVVSRELIQYMRSRNIQFVSKNLKPLTQVYAFFDGVDITKYCTPKLIEISMISGVFEVGEDVIGTTDDIVLLDSINTSPAITFRVAQSNHKEGQYNSPSSVYPLNPYTSQPLGETYSSTSTIINVDTFSLSAQYQGQYSGWISAGMTLVGKTSGAQATITNVRLVSDVYTSLIGSFYLPNPNISVNPRFENGSKTFALINNNLNDTNLASTLAEEKFISSGTLETVQENIISTRNGRIEQKQEIQQEDVSRTTGPQLVNSQIVSQTTNYGYRCYWWDPLAQSFLVKEASGVFLTSCDIFFKTKDNDETPVFVQIRTMQGGVPTRTVLPFSEVFLDPEQVNTSDNGSVATKFTFKAPVYLEGNNEYALVVGSTSSKYNVFISRVGVGEVDILTQSAVSTQPTLGSLFKSQNASTWEPSQWEDLKFTLYRAEFVQSGRVEFYNPELSIGNSQIPTLMPNSLSLQSRKIRIALSNPLSDNNLKLGNTVYQDGSDGTGNYVGNAGIATGSLTVINSGIGYTPSTGSVTYSSVDLVSITGNGRNAKADITIDNGVAVAATISESYGGNGYQVGDVLGITTLGSTSLGRNAILSLVSIASTSELILDNVQGEFLSGVGKTVSFINSLGVSTTLNSSVGGNVQISGINIETDGLHIVVNHKNHGMNFENNYVKIFNVKSDVPPTKLSSERNYNSSGPILVDSAADFGTFENVGVGTTNPGYALVGNVLFEYTSVSANSLNDVTKVGFIDPAIPNNLLSALQISYGSGTPVYKYELGGVSLLRINKTHYLGDATVSDPISFDSYAIKIKMDLNGTDRSSGVGFPKLYVNNTKSDGGFNIKATQNIPFELITPNIQNTTVQGTNLSAEIRTISGSSISGNEIGFVDKGFEPIALNKTNYFDTPRIIASRVNETEFLTELPGKKSLNLRLNLSTADTLVSPVVDTQRMSVILTTNRINKVISNYATDNRVNAIGTDPSSFQYISKEIVLEAPASSIKIILDAHVNVYCDLRAFYAIGESQNFTPIFTPFPGYNNLDERQQIINFENSNGLSDTLVQPSSSLGFESANIEFREYTFTADQLPSFRSYRVKLVLTSTSQVYPPRVKNLRVIALA
jgi:hypothetical protein